MESLCIAAATLLLWNHGHVPPPAHVRLIDNIGLMGEGITTWD